MCTTEVTAEIISSSPTTRLDQILTSLLHHLQDRPTTVSSGPNITGLFSSDNLLYIILLNRSLGMLKEAEIIEQQMLSRAAPAQPDYSAQWAEYYRCVLVAMLRWQDLVQVESMQMMIIESGRHTNFW